MFIIGERINTSRQAIRPSVENKDASAVRKEAKKQVQAGANMIDVNCGTFLNNEPEYMEWLVNTVQEAVSVPLCIDSPNPEAIRIALNLHKNGKPLINSISNESDRFNMLLPLILEYHTSVVALCTGGSGAMPQTTDDRMREATMLIGKLTSAGVPLADIFVDPVICPVSTDSSYGVAAINAISRIKAEFEGVHTICGLSNVSYGLPLRKLLNQNFLVLCMGAGLDSVILDPLDQRIMSNLLATEALLGHDEYCMNYVTASREEKLTL